MVFLDCKLDTESCANRIQGNLAFGTGGLNYYNGTSLAINEDVVVVTINYRTNSESLEMRLVVQ